MDADDLEPAIPRTGTVNLESMSIEALREYVAGLEAEMARARAMIASKEGAKSRAASIFRS